MLATSNVTVEFSGLRALDGVSLSLDREEILGLIGPNGSGKTTLVNAITGQVPLAVGEVKLDDTPITGWRPRRVALAGISRSFQIARLFNAMTVRENVEAAALAQGRRFAEARALATELLDELMLADRADALGDELNYGDKRRVEIARALAAGPKYLLLDEPAAGMNEVESAQLLKILSELPRAKKLGLLIIDHDMSLILRLCNRIHVLASGRTIAQGSPQEVRSNPAVIEAYLGSAAGHG